MSRQGQVRECIALARSSLIRARILRQEADIAAEFDALYGPEFTPSDMAEGIRARARAHRKHARELLQTAERVNGELYVDLGSEYLTPLKSQLNGQDFNLWNEYAEQYLHHPQFRGVDPN